MENFCRITAEEWGHELKTAVQSIRTKFLSTKLKSVRLYLYLLTPGSFQKRLKLAKVNNIFTL